MRSVGEAQQRLPNEFVDSLYQIFPSPIADKIMQGYAKQRYPSLRCNTLKTDIRTTMQTLQENRIKFERVLWYPDGLVIKNVSEKELEQLPCYQTGSIYLQSLSSMIPPLMLKPFPNEKVLDLTAAPGSKTCQMSALMQNKGEILAVELDKIRYQRLLYNLKKQGCHNVTTLCVNGVHVGNEYPETFDKVLLDAPCSGEGLFSITDAKSYRSWRTKLVRRCASLQRRLIHSAIEALKPGGSLVYSTCTLNPEENELVIQKALIDHAGKLMIKPSAIKIPRSIQGLTTVDGNPLHPDLIHAIRILPTEYFEGFFCCHLTKSY